jgi:hypothetical protein
LKKEGIAGKLEFLKTQGGPQCTLKYNFARIKTVRLEDRSEKETSRYIPKRISAIAAKYVNGHLLRAKEPCYMV